MRIRKYVSKVLGTASSQQQSSPAMDLSAAAWMMQQQPYSCEVNRSRWDVFPLGEASDKEEEQENSSTIGDDEEIKRGGREEEAAMSAITSRSSSSSNNNTAELKPKEGEELATTTDIHESEEDDWKPKKMKKRANKANKGKKTTTTTTTTTTITTMRTAAMKEESKYIKNSTTAYTCKKTDGKQWRCKVLVDQPNSLCDYHLDQLLSYRCTSNTTRKTRRAAFVRNTTASSRKRPRQKRTRTSAVTVESMYYYSAFGPWRGKQRGVEPAAVPASVKEHSEEEQLERYLSIQDVDDDDNGDSSDGDDTGEESSGKKKRRPVKARSLKSLL